MSRLSRRLADIGVLAAAVITLTLLTALKPAHVETSPGRQMSTADRTHLAISQHFDR